MLRRYAPLRPSQRKRDPVKPEVAISVLERDQGCIPARYGAPGECLGRIELHHVRPGPGEPRISKARWLVSACSWHHGTNRYGGGWATSKEGLGKLREYLRDTA